MKRCYVSGPMTDMPEFNVPAFNAAANLLRAQGFEVVNPAELDSADDAPRGSRVWADYLRRDIRALMDCSVIAMLPGFESSKGARLELHIAMELGFEVIYFKPPTHSQIAAAAAEEVE